MNTRILNIKLNKSLSSWKTSVVSKGLTDTFDVGTKKKWCMILAHSSRYLQVKEIPQSYEISYFERPIINLPSNGAFPDVSQLLIASRWAWLATPSFSMTEMIPLMASDSRRLIWHSDRNLSCSMVWDLN